MTVTVNTDASHCPKTKRAGFAYWIVCDEFVIQTVGPFKTKVKNSTRAECLCIVNALTQLSMHSNTVHRIVINTDYFNAKDFIEKRAVEDPLRIQYDKVVKALRYPQIEFRHVRAHHDTASPRTYVNNWCDFYAKRAMREGYTGSVKQTFIKHERGR